MTSNVTTISSHDAIALALQMMLWSGVRHLPVVDDDHLVGIVSDRDLLPARGAIEGQLKRQVSEVMHSPVKSVHPDDDVREAAGMMATSHIHCLPVVDDDRLVGIITSSDVLAERGRLFFENGRARLPRVAELMTRDPICFKQDDKLFNVVVQMVREDIRHAPIVDDGRRVIGIVTDRDLRVVVGEPLRALAESDELDLDDLTAAHAMTPHPVTVSEDASILSVTHTFIDQRVGAAPVIDADSRLVGIVSYVDLLKFFVGAEP
jgi:CBS domain-containing protein